jgi:hypothetical protein
MNMGTLYADRSGGPERWETYTYDDCGRPKYLTPCYGKGRVISLAKKLDFEKIIFIGEEVIKIASY